MSDTEQLGTHVHGRIVVAVEGPVHRGKGDRRRAGDRRRYVVLSDPKGRLSWVRLGDWLTGATQRA